MQTLNSFIGGGVLLQIWRQLWGMTKLVLVICLAAFTGFEFAIHSSNAWNAWDIYGGQGAQGQGQMADPVKTRAAMDAGQEVSGAKRQAAVTYETQAAEATIKGTEAKAITISEEELLAKAKRHIPLTAAENLRLSEIRLRQAEAKVKEAEARSADLEADAKNAVNAMLLEYLGPGADQRDLANDQFDRSFNQTPGFGAPKRDFGGLADKMMDAFTPKAFAGARGNHAPAVERTAPLFNCARAALGVDFVICANPQLIGLEAKLEDAARAARDKGGDGVTRGQRIWSSNLGPRCGLPAKGQPAPALMAQSRVCVLNAMNRRLDDLLDYLANG